MASGEDRAEVVKRAVGMNAGAKTVRAVILLGDAMGKTGFVAGRARDGAELAQLLQVD